MTIQIDIKNNVEQVRATLRLTGSEVVAASVRALNRTAGTARKVASQALKKEYPGIKSAQIKRRIRLVRASKRKAEAALVFSGRRFVLFDNFGMRSVGEWGVSFRRLPWRVETVSGDPVSAAMLARAFRQRGRGGRANVWARSGPARESIELLLAPSLARSFAERAISRVLIATVRDRFPIVLEQEAKFRISKR